MEKAEVVSGKIKYMFAVITILVSILLFMLGKYSESSAISKNKEAILKNTAQITQVETVVGIQIKNLNENIQKLETAVHELTAELKAQQNIRR